MNYRECALMNYKRGKLHTRSHRFRFIYCLTNTAFIFSDLIVYFTSPVQLESPLLSITEVSRLTLHTAYLSSCLALNTSTNTPPAGIVFWTDVAFSIILFMPVSDAGEDCRSVFKPYFIYIVIISQWSSYPIITSCSVVVLPEWKRVFFRYRTKLSPSVH